MTAHKLDHQIPFIFHKMPRTLAYVRIFVQSRNPGATIEIVSLTLLSVQAEPTNLDRPFLRLSIYSGVRGSLTAVPICT